MTISHQRTIGPILALSIILFAGSCREPKPADRLSLYALESHQTISGSQVSQALKSVRLVLVGEHHTDPAHHQAQLQVIRFLDRQAAPLSIGLEMFRKDQQEALDRWISGAIDEGDFKKIYQENWNYPWPLYRDIFIHARENKIPLVGLNVSRDITRQVARNGFASLSKAQRGQLEGITCDVTREYRDFIRRAFGAHGHGSMDFGRFCEAQLVWDSAMAVNALDYLDQHPDRVMVLLAGSGHARKMGVPYQVGQHSLLSLAVLLPRTAGIFEPDSLTTADADFIIMP